MFAVLIRRRAGIFLLAFFLLGSPLYARAEAEGEPEDKTAENMTHAVETEKPDRTPAGAFYRALAFPGWGQYYNGKRLKAALAFCLETTYLTLAVLKTGDVRHEVDSQQRKNLRTERNTYAYGFILIKLIAGLDAYVDAHLRNFDVTDTLTMNKIKINLPGKFPTASIKTITGLDGYAGVQVSFYLK